MTRLVTSAPGLQWPDPDRPGTMASGSQFLNQWMTMTGRAARSARSEGEFTIAVIMPLVFALGFYLPLRVIMTERGLDYAQFLMPIIVLQTTASTALSAAQRSAMDAMRGMNKRLSSMPMQPLVPMLARLSMSAIRSLVSIVAALLYGTVLGFRFSGSALHTVVFLAFAIAVSMVLSIGADSLGLLAKSPEATSQLLVLPQLVLGLLSTGFVPESGFPQWARPFARNQPISHFAATMRDLADGTPSLTHAVPAIGWLAGLAIVFIALAYYAQQRRPVTI